MDRAVNRNEYLRREQRMTRILLAVAAVVLFCGLFSQIAVRAQISGQNKQIQAVRQQIKSMTADADNLSMCINQHYNLEAIGKRAYALGMTQPSEGQLRRINLPQTFGDTSTQTVANVGGEEIIG